MGVTTAAGPGRDHRLGRVGAKPGCPAGPRNRGHPARTYEPARPSGGHVPPGQNGADIDRLAEQLVKEKIVRIDRAEKILKEWSKSK